MRIISVRHGETKKNKERIVQDSVRGGLNKKGLMQAKKLALRLSEESFNKIYCSDAERAKETASEIIKFHPHVPIEYTEELREMNSGKSVGLSWGEHARIKEESKEGFAKFKPEGGESIMDVVIRTNNFLNKLHKNHKRENILLITSGGVNKSLKHLSENGLVEPTRGKGYEQDNCCVNIFEYDKEKLKLISYNDTRHLNLAFNPNK